MTDVAIAVERTYLREENTYMLVDGQPLLISGETVAVSVPELFPSGEVELTPDIIDKQITGQQKVIDEIIKDESTESRWVLYGAAGLAAALLCAAGVDASLPHSIPAEAFAAPALPVLAAGEAFYVARMRARRFDMAQRLFKLFSTKESLELMVQDTQEVPAVEAA